MRRWVVRGLFLGAVVALPLQLAVRETSSEPYPGLYQPSFGGEVPSGDVYRTVEPRLTVQDADGSTSRVSYLDLLPRTEVLPLTVFRHGFFRTPVTQQPATRAWTRDRLRAIAPGSDPQRLVVEWLALERRPGSARATVTEVVDREDLDVRGAS